MASNPYQVEHNIQEEERPHTRRPDMSSFTSHLHRVAPENSSSSSASSDTATPTHQQHHAGPTPVDAAALFRLVQDQMSALAVSAPSDTNRSFLESLITALESDIDAPPEHIRGVTQEYLDGLDRVPRKRLSRDDTCPICAEGFLDDEYPLVVQLPCHGSHRFMLECVGPWLLSKGTCPMCRKNLAEKKKVEIVKDDDEEDGDVDGLYG